MIEYEYEEYSANKDMRFRLVKVDKYYDVVLEKYTSEIDFMGYFQPAGFYRVHDMNVHHVDSIETGIIVGKELMRNCI